MSKRLVALLVALVGGGLLAGVPVAILRGISAQAMTCNIIPRAVKLLRSDQGLVDRPVAGPGDTVTITADLGCDTSLAKPGFSPVAAQNVVTLEFQGPEGLTTPPSVPATVLRVLDCEDPTVVSDARCNTLQLRMPDTSDAAGELGLDVLAGPALLRVMDGAVTVGIVFQLFQPSLGCGDLAADPSFGKFTVLPPANVLPTPEEGAGEILALLGALDGNGNAVFPFNVGDALVAPPGDPIATIIEYQAPFLSLIPTQDFLLSYNAFGQRIPPLLRLTATKTMLGTIDVREGLMQILQTSGPASVEVDFETLVERDTTGQLPVGPIRLPSRPPTPPTLPGPLAFEIVSATPLLALRSSVGTVAIGADEELLGRELNQDGDAPLPIDLVAQITDLATGAHTETGMALGDAFSAPRPALVVDDDLVAFLQSEDSSGESDLNLDGDALDQVFRAFDAGHNLTPGPLPAQTSADSSPVLDGRQLAISDRFVFFRTAEADEPPSRQVWERGTGSGTLKSGKLEGKFRFATDFEDVPDVDYSAATPASDPGKFSGVKLQCGSATTATLSGNWLAPGTRPRFNATVVTGACTTSGTCPEGTVTCEGGLSVPSASPPLPAGFSALRFRATFQVGALAAAKRSFTTSFEFSALTGPDGLESLNGDADALDTVLQSFDAATPSLQPEARTAASRVATAGGRALLLTSEAEEGNASLNGDPDAADAVAQLYDGPSAMLVNLRRAATDVALSPEVACVAVSESGEQSDLDLDGDRDDAVLFTGTPSALLGGAAALENTRIPVTKLGALGTRCVAIVPDAGGGVLAIYDHATGSFKSTEQAVEDEAFVLGAERGLVAFRTPEARQGDLNGDGDTADSVMQVWKILEELTVNTGRQAIPCDVAGCEAFQLGTIVGSTLTFLGTEAGQAVGEGCLPQSPPDACDLDGDGDGDGTVVHTVTFGDPVSFAVIPFNGDLDAACVPFAEVFAGGVKICECLTECDAAEQACWNPGRFNGDPLSVVPELGCEEQHDIDSNGVLDCRAAKVFCDVDSDGDGVFNQIDACPVVFDSQTDVDEDLLGDACDPLQQPVSPCDLDCNVSRGSPEEALFIDQRDIELVFAAVGTRAQGFAACGDRRDRDRDRFITILDFAACVGQCTCANCAEPVAGSCP